MPTRRLSVTHRLLGDVVAEYVLYCDQFVLIASVPDEGLFVVRLNHGSISFTPWFPLRSAVNRPALPAVYLPWFDRDGNSLGYPVIARALREVEQALRLQWAEVGA